MNEEFEVKEYEIFNQAITSASKIRENIEICIEDLKTIKSQLNNDNVFLGPICDSCMEGYTVAEQKAINTYENIATVEEYLKSVNTLYQESDKQAVNTIKPQTLSFNENKIEVKASSVVTGNEVQDTLYNYLSQQGFNDAAISGILANIERESSFNPNSYGDYQNGVATSYGMCQWHNDRWTNLENYCKEKQLDSSTTEAQAEFLVHELKNSYPGVYNTLQNVPNTADGAYKAAYAWAVNYEVPADKYNEGRKRGNNAVSNYWSVYG